jgi:hypothetical protein
MLILLRSDTVCDTDLSIRLKVWVVYTKYSLPSLNRKAAWSCPSPGSAANTLFAFKE